VATNDDGPQWLADYRPVEADISTLGKFAKALRDEVELNFGPHAQRVMNMLDPGTGALPGRPGFWEWEATRGRYTDGRNRAITLMDTYARVTLEIAAAAELIARRYQDSDAFARAQVTDVHDAFTEAAKVYGVTDA